MSNVGTALREARLRAGLSQESLAEKLGTAQPHVSAIETGKRSPSWDYIIRFAEALKVSAISLLREAGLITEDNADLEQEIAAMVERYPDMADVFEYARDDPRILEELVRFGRLLILEKEARDNEMGGAAGGDSRGDS